MEHISPSPTTIFVIVGTALCLSVVLWVLCSKSNIFYASAEEWLDKLGYAPKIWFNEKDLVWLDEQFSWVHFMNTGDMPPKRGDVYIYPHELQLAVTEYAKELIARKLEAGELSYE